MDLLNCKDDVMNIMNKMIEYDENEKEKFNKKITEKTNEIDDLNACKKENLFLK